LAAAQQMRGLTESLLTLARLDTGHEPLQCNGFDLAEETRACLDLVRPLVLERRLQLKTDLAATPCHGDAKRLAQVITNLLTNAIHYTPAEGEVRVSTRAENGFAILVVADSGIGIDAADLPHVFERFYRADRARSRSEGRSGLGLAISKAIVDAHGGTIEVTSQIGQGSVFTLRLSATLVS
jgi:signal transduction histidine kinase